MPKSTEDIPFFICFSGFISSEDKTTARKSEPLIIFDELTKDVMLFNISLLNSFNVLSKYNFN